MTDELTGSPLGTVRLTTIAHSAAAFADDLRKRPTRDERHARGVLIALETAILHGGLDTLITAIAPWLRAEVARVDALLNGPAHDRLSAAVGEMAVPAEDIEDAARLGIQFDERSLVTDPEELAALRLPDSYSGIGG